MHPTWFPSSTERRRRPDDKSTWTSWQRDAAHAVAPGAATGPETVAAVRPAGPSFSRTAPTCFSESKSKASSSGTRGWPTSPILVTAQSFLSD